MVARGNRRWLLTTAWLMACLALLVALPGCGGCRKDPAKVREELAKKRAEERARKKKEKKPDFEGIQGAAPRLATRPSGRLAIEGSEVLGPPYKPGHWTATTLAIKANNFDFVGDLAVAATDRKGDVLPLPNTEFDLNLFRQVSLPKRQPKVFESVLMVPPTSQQALVSWRLNHAKGGRPAWSSEANRLSRMPSYQYHLVVLARWPGRYPYLRGLASIKPPADEFAGDSTKPYYRVTLIGDPKRVLLPSHGLFWTSIAYLVWDGADPALLTLDQQQSLLDWLHWGGQLILSGPETLDVLKGSFLADYLPATIAPGVRELGQADFEPLRDWANSDQQKPVRPLVQAREIEGIRLQKHAEARFIPHSGDLIVERRVGRGRIVASAFRLSGDLASQPGFDEVFNAFLLGRPARRFTDHAEQGPQVSWADGRNRLDAARISNLRYFTRDTGLGLGTYGPDTRSTDLDFDGTEFDDSQSPAGPGLAAWNDFGPVAHRARNALLSAAQIEIPEANFVLWIIAGYLVVLVPANWAVFRVLGRVEWAWVAAPVIAVVCTAVVIRAAQLDIGFARSRTEIAVVELQAGYHRAHLTHYTALYSALTTHYDFQFDDPGAVVLPFPKGAEDAAFDAQRRLEYRTAKGVSLRDYYVRSNSTGLVHSEQMLDLGGALSLKEISGGGRQVINRTNLTLCDAAVVRRDESGNIETAWLGTLEPGAAAVLRFRRRAAVRPGELLWQDRYEYATLSGSNLQPGELNLRELVALAQGQTTDDKDRSIAPLDRGEMRLIAGLRLKRGLPGQTIQPAAPQAQVAGLVVAHLEQGFAADPQPDVNTRETPQRIGSSTPFDTP